MPDVTSNARRALIAAPAAVALALLWPPLAGAHQKLVSTTPERNSAAPATQRVVRVTFDGPIRRGSLTVTRPDGTRASVGAGGRDPRNIERLTTQLRRGLPAGRYVATWRIVAADGHDQSGTFAFRLVRR